MLRVARFWALTRSGNEQFPLLFVSFYLFLLLSSVRSDADHTASEIVVYTDSYWFFVRIVLLSLFFASPSPLFFVNLFVATSHTVLTTLIVS